MKSWPHFFQGEQKHRSSASDVTAISPRDRAQLRALAKHFAAPKRAETQYVADLRKMQKVVWDGVMTVVRDKVLPDPDWRQDQDRANVGALGGGLLERIVRFTTPQTQQAFDRMHKEVMKARNRTPEATARLESDLAKRIHERLSIPGIDHGLQGIVAVKRAENVDLIKSVQSDMLDDLRSVLAETDGQSISDIEDALVARGNVPLSRVNLIARDQTLKLNSAITQHRCRAAGIDKYEWSTSLDERVRPGHAALEGQSFSWSDPPETNDDGDRNNPGEDFQCRCVACPILEEDDGEEEATEGESEDDPGEPEDLAAE